MTVDNKLRSYRLFRPPSLDMTKAVPLVVVLHGSPIDASGFEGVIHFDATAAKAGYLVAGPNGCGGFWSYTQGGSKVADQDFIVQTIHRLKAEFQIDNGRVYVIASSAGSPVAYRLACDLSAEIAAVASISGKMRLADDCRPARPVSLLAMQGTEDRNNRLPGDIAEVIERWKTLDGCVGDPTVTQTGITTTSTWTACKGGAVVRFDKVVGGRHTWFGSDFDSVPGEPDANATIWSFFSGLPPRS
jgi:polyhydroxybutyrate depolymerase